MDRASHDSGRAPTHAGRVEVRGRGMRSALAALVTHLPPELLLFVLTDLLLPLLDDTAQRAPRDASSSNQSLGGVLPRTLRDPWAARLL
ncbi:MAG: hypothetical protein A2Y95_06515 [Deltaproteobacteria bacterium RBG_13_65_10]|nr:MAG: hypothetical protein A2Y95_06515 [Deltaproteobacteria bacterium RBG_13_65_10]